MLTKEDLLRVAEPVQEAVDATAKRRESALIAAQVEEFLAKGGEITILKPEDYKQNPTGQPNNHLLFIKEPLANAPKRNAKNNFVINNRTNKLSTGELKRFTGKNKQVKA